MPLSKTVILPLLVISTFTVCYIPTDTFGAEQDCNVRIDYISKMNEVVKADRDEELNGSVFYEKAFELIGDLPKEITSSELKSWPAELSIEKQELLQNWIQSTNKALEQLELGTQRPYCWYQYQGDSMLEISLPSLAGTRKLAYAICMRAKLNASKGDLKKAFSDLLICYRFGRHFSGPKTLIEQLVGIATERLASQTGLQILANTKPESSLLQDFQGKLEKLFDNEIHVNFTGEKLLSYDNIQRIFTEQRNDGCYISKEEIQALINMVVQLKSAGSSSPTQEQIRQWEKLEKRQSLGLVDKMYEYFDSAAKKTPAQLRNQGKEIDSVILEMTKDNPFVRWITPNVGRVAEMAFRKKTEADALITTLALLRYKADKGQYPQGLDELVSAGYIKELPIDLYSDKPIAYKKRDDNFILYSFGADFDDDGGTASKWGDGNQGGDQVFWPVKKTSR